MHAPAPGNPETLDCRELFSSVSDHLFFPVVLLQSAVFMRVCRASSSHNSESRTISVFDASFSGTLTSASAVDLRMQSLQHSTLSRGARFK